MKIKIKKPKIKISAPKAVTKAIQSVTKPIETVAKGAIKSTGDIASSALKGDIKGLAGGALGAVDVIKEAGKQALSGQLGVGSALLGDIGSAVGSKDIKTVAKNVEREGKKGIEQYGDIAMDVGANVATGGGYGTAKAATQSLASSGLKGLLSGKGLQEAALGAASSYAGVDPNMLKAGLSAVQGDLKGAALSQLGSLSGFDPKQLQTGLSAITGDKAGLVSSLASQAGAGEDLASAAGQLASGKKVEDIAMRQALKKGRGIASDVVGAKAKDLGIDQLINKNKFAQDAKRIARETIERGQNTISSAQERLVTTEKKTLAQIAKEQGIDPKELLKMNPQLKNVNSSIAEGQEVFLKPTMEGPGVMERALGAVKSGIKKIPGAISSGLSGAKKFAAENKTGLSLGADVLAAGAGYMAGEAGRKEAKGLSEQQLKELKGAGAAFEKMQYDPTRYKQEREFIQQRIAGGGVTAEEKKMQQEGDIRAARAAAAQRLAGMEQQARMGAGATGAGASLAASLAGGQAAMSEQSAANLAREASASQRLEQDIQRQTNLARQQTSEEADLAQQQGTFGLSRAQQTGAVRGDLGNLALGRAAALQNLAGQGAEMVKTGLSMAKTPQEQAAEDEQKQMQAESQRLDLEKKRRDVYGAQPQQPQQTPPPPSQAKTNAARRVSMGPKQPTQQPQQKTSASTQFNQANIPTPNQGQGYGVLAPVQQAAQKVQSTVDQAKQKAEEFKKNPLGAFGIKF